MDTLGIGWVDIALAAVLLASVIVGLVRGFVFELLSLAGWVAAWFAAQWAAPEIAPHLPIGAHGSALNHGAAFLCAFVAALIIWSLLARLVRLLIHATPLSVPDRLLGGVFGVVRGAVLLLVLATLVGFTPLARSAAWQQSRGAAILHAVLQGLLPLLPPQASDYRSRA
jgi:membrane protein required for colicin V production